MAWRALVRGFRAAALVLFLLLPVAVPASACGGRPSGIDRGIAAEIGQIRAIDHHAHPVRVVGRGERPDRDFDALPVDNMEPSSDPVNLRPDAPVIVDAWSALSGYTYTDLRGDHLKEARERKQHVIEEKADRFPAWVLDQMGVDVMFANRVEMGTSVQAPRFRWVPYVDALMFPLDNSSLAQRNTDRKSFF